MSALFVVAMKTEPKKSIREVIYARVRMGKCICHDEKVKVTSPEDPAFCDGDEWSLGVCSKHHREYMRSVENLGAVKVNEITDRLVEEGQILRPYTIRDIKRETPISRIVKELVEK